MTEDQAAELIQLLTDKFSYVSFMLEALFYALCFVGGCICVQLIIHSKNQKNLF